VREKLQIESCRLQVFQNRRRQGVLTFNFQPSTFNHDAFSLVEILVVVSLLSLIVLALMAVFSSTQNAFRSSVTQTDVLEGGRNAMDLIASDVREMRTSGGVTNGAINFFVAVPGGYAPLIQSLPASSSSRTNILERVFILTRENQTWTGIGYVVDTNSTAPINPLYRFAISTNVAAVSNPRVLFNIFDTSSVANMSHVLDGVVHLQFRAYDPNGVWMNNFSTNAVNFDNHSLNIPTPPFGETGFYMFSNTVPAAVEIELGVLEDRTLRRAESIGNSLSQSNYLAGHAGQVHIFRQRVTIQNVDSSAYR